MAREIEKQEQSQELEDKIESLTRELSGLINEAGTQGRDELRDYAVSLIQGETETAVIEEPPQTAAAPASSSNPLALSIPFVLIGVILLPLFPPVGLFLLLVAFVMGIWGGLSIVLFGRK